MSGDRVQRVKELLERVLQAEPEIRQHMLDAAQRLTPDGEHIANEVRALLAELDVAGRFLQPPTIAPPTLAKMILSPESLGEGVGSRIGPYHILEQLGEGGFGVVYLAEQEQPIRRRVALKVIKLGMDTRQVIARFEQERQALAIMDHPGIAKVLEAGATATGRPYFAMELVRGIPITRFCDERRLGVHQRLELFAQVCDAVQHAHHRGVIHRDLKPSNILVTCGDDDRPVPKVIDFGIAKATQARLAERTLFTESSQLLGTPEYMSPEQAGFGTASAADIDTRTDVYSLGVLLYELLTGVTPFDPRHLRSAAFDELCRVIREVDPPRPSTRLSAIETIDQVASMRHTEPARLRQSIRGELDWIVMRCLEKDRTRRYASAADLARDISRHINHEALEAAPPGAAYRVRKFMRRHRREVAVAATLLITLVLGVVGTAVGAARAVRARDDAFVSEQRAILAAETEAAERRRADATALEARKLAYSLSIGVALTDIDQGAVKHARARLALPSPDLRGWEWSHLTWACDPVSRSFDTPPDTIDLALTADGSRLFTRGLSGEVRVFNAATARLEHSFMTPSGKAWRFRMPQVNHNGTLMITSIADHSDGWTGDGIITLWDVAAGAPLWTERTTTLLGASFQGGRWRRTHDGLVRLDLHDETELDRVVYTKEPLRAAAGPIEGTRSAVFVVEGSGWNILWNLDANREITRFGADSSIVVPTPPAGIVAVTTDRILRIDARTGEMVVLPFARNDVRELRSGGRRAFALQSRQGVIRTFAWPNTEPLFKVNTLAQTETAFATDSIVAYVIGEHGVTQARNFSSGQPFRVEVSWRGGYCAAISPTGRHSAIAGWGSVCLFDTHTGENMWSRYPHRDSLYAAAFSADGRYLAVAGRSRVITIFDAANGNPDRTIALPANAMVTSLAWSHAGNRLLAGLWDGRILECDPVTPGTDPMPWPNPASSSITALAFSPDDEHVFAVARSGLKLKDYYYHTPGTEQTIRIHKSRDDYSVLGLLSAKHSIRGAAFAPDGRSAVVSADDSIVLIQSPSAHVIARAATTQPGEAVAFSPDGSRIAVVGFDDMLRVFAAADLSLAASLPCGTWSDKRDAAFSPDGRTLLVADPSTPVIAYESGPTEHHERRLRVALARGPVDRAFLSTDFVSDRARAMIAADADMPEDLRPIALALAEARGDDPNQINSTTLLRSPTTPPGPDWIPLVEQMRAAVRVLPNDAGLRVTLALTELRSGMPAQAAATVQTVLDGAARDPDEKLVLAWSILSLTYSDRGQPQLARSSLDQAKEIRGMLLLPPTSSTEILIAEAQRRLQDAQSTENEPD